jgi:transposase
MMRDLTGSNGRRLRLQRRRAEQLAVIPAQIRVLNHIRPKYACPCCHSGVLIAPLPATLFPKSILTPSLAAQITTAKFVDGIPLYRQEPQFERMGILLGRGTMALWMIRIGGTFIVPLINLLNELLLAGCRPIRAVISMRPRSSASRPVTPKWH